LRSSHGGGAAADALDVLRVHPGVLELRPALAHQLEQLVVVVVVRDLVCFGSMALEVTQVLVGAVLAPVAVTLRVAVALAVQAGVTALAIDEVDLTRIRVMDHVVGAVVGRLRPRVLLPGLEAVPDVLGDRALPVRAGPVPLALGRGLARGREELGPPARGEPGRPARLERPQGRAGEPVGGGALPRPLPRDPSPGYA